LKPRLSTSRIERTFDGWIVASRRCSSSAVNAIATTRASASRISPFPANGSNA